jgi:uroporphyrinogen decarboxylase
LQPPETDFEYVTSILERQVQRLAAGDTLVVGYNELTLYERAELLLGTTDFLIATALHSDPLERLLDVITMYQLRLTEAILRSGVSGIRFTDDWGTQISMFISPIQWIKLIKPRLKQLYDLVHQYDAFVFQHSCGHIEEIVPDLIEIGVDVLDPCQPQANDIFEWKRKYGDCLSFMGGLDTQGYLSLGEPSDVKKHVKEVVQIMGRGGGYIAAPSHSITIPESNRQAMLEALSEIRSGMI